MVDYDGTIPSKIRTAQDTKGVDGNSRDPPSSSENKDTSQQNDASRKQNNEDDVFSDSDGEEPTASTRSSVDHHSVSAAGSAPQSESGSKSERVSSVSHQTERLSLGRESISSQSRNSSELKVDEVDRASAIPNLGSTDIKAIAADASVFSFGDDEDDESE